MIPRHRALSHWGLTRDPANRSQQRIAFNYQMHAPIGVDLNFAAWIRRVIGGCTLLLCVLATACKHDADTSNTRSCRLIAGLDFAGTVTDATGRTQRTTMTFTRVSGAPEAGRVIFNGSVNGTDLWITDSAKTFVANGQTRLVTAANDTLALSCVDRKRTLSCENASRSRCLLTEASN